MTSEAQNAAATLCPTCQARTLPDPFVYSVVACYTCGSCGTEWSARLRNGRPDVRLYPMSAVGRTTEPIAPLCEFPRPRHEREHTPYRNSMTPQLPEERMR